MTDEFPDVTDPDEPELPGSPLPQPGNEEF